jgi:hypothetical protein
MSRHPKVMEKELDVDYLEMEKELGSPTGLESVLAQQLELQAQTHQLMQSSQLNPPVQSRYLQHR